VYERFIKLQHVHHLGLLTTCCSTYKDTSADPHVMTVLQNLKQLLRFRRTFGYVDGLD
jgi:hypothetical protein